MKIRLKVKLCQHQYNVKLITAHEVKSSHVIQQRFCATALVSTVTSRYVLHS